MPSVFLNKALPPIDRPENPLPSLLHTPSGLALIELQGTIHFPPPSTSSSTTRIGKLVFPLYDPDSADPSDTKWMKRVYFYIGENQRMTGECKKLAKPVAVVRKRLVGEDGDVDMEGAEGAGGEELEIVEIVRYRVVFSARPEPVSDIAVGEQEEG